MIDIIIPVLARPQNAQPVVDSIRATATVPCQVVFVCTPGDDDQIVACKATGENVLLLESDNHQYPRKVNAAFHATTNPWLLLIGDDVEFQPGWDETALSVARATGRSIIGLNDLTNRHVMEGRFSTSPLVSRRYVTEHGGSLDGPGFVLHPGYDHNFVDRELAHLAQFRNEYAFTADAHILHRWKANGEDDTYRKGQKGFRADQRLFFDRAPGWGYVGLTRQEQMMARRRQPRAVR